MKRRWLLLLGSLMLMLGVFVPNTAFAEESLPFEYKEPDESVKLFDELTFEYDEDGYGIRTNYRFCQGADVIRILGLSTGFKAILYDSNTKVYSSDLEREVTDSRGKVTKGVTQVDFDSFEDVISRGAISYGSCDLGVTDDTYVLIFKPDAESLSDVVYTCKYSDILNHVGATYCGVGNNIKVELVKTIPNDDGSVDTAEFKVTYDLDIPCDTFHVTGYDSIELSDKKSGVQNITLENLSNFDYKFSFYAGGDDVCSTLFKVDFVKRVEKFYSPDDVEKVKDADVEPEVTFRGIPKEAYVGETIKIEMVTNVNSTMNFNGSLLNNDFAKSNTVEINCNGNFYYSVVSEGGKSKTGVLKIDCFLKSPDNKERADNYDDGNHLTIADLSRQNNEKTTNEKKKDVKIISIVIQSDKKKVEVPKTITDENGKKQKVTELGEKAFVKCSNVKQIVLHANIVYVNENAFSGISTKDKTIFLDASLTKKEVKKIEKKLRKAGFKGSIVQAKKNPVKKTADK